MARIRMVKPEFFDDPDIADLSVHARLFFIGLWLHADREGRLEDCTKRLKARIFPYEDVDAEALTVELHGKDMIRRFSSRDGKRYLWVRNFLKHQRPHPKEPPSVIPSWDDRMMESRDLAVEKHGEPCKKTAGTPESGTRNLGHGSLDTESGGRHPEASVMPAVIGPNTAIVLVANPKDDGFETFWKAYPRKVGKDDARKAFLKRRPDLDLLALMLQAIERQKTEPQWQKDGGQFIPHPATWLNSARWMDAPIEVSKAPQLSKRTNQILAAVQAIQQKEEQ